MPQKAKVAVFEDTPGQQYFIRRYLEKGDHQIVGSIAATRQEAEELVRLIIIGEVKPDAILLDHRLIGITGEKIAAKLVEHEVIIPIIGISSMTKQPYAAVRISKTEPTFDRQIVELINDL